jgi:hypothetical protein
MHSLTLSHMHIRTHTIHAHHYSSISLRDASSEARAI